MILQKAKTIGNDVNHFMNGETIYQILPKKYIIEAYRWLLTTRKLDQKLLVLLKQGKAPFHVGASGHEAAQIAMAMNLKPGQDWAYPYYRDIAFLLALGAPLQDIISEYFSKDTAPHSGGRQLYGHWSSKSLNIVSQSSPTGSQFLQAVGTAMACKWENQNKPVHKKEVVYVSSGEGATSEGDFYEALNWATREKLPVIFFIEDNRYAISVPASEQITGGSLYDLTSGYKDLHRFNPNGNDFFEMYDVTRKACDLVRKGEGPSLIVANVHRLLPHSSSDNHAQYRPKEELERIFQEDCLVQLEEKIDEESVLTPEELKHLRDEVSQTIEQAVSWASSQPDPQPDSVSLHLMDSEQDVKVHSNDNSTKVGSIVMVDAINHALHEEMNANDKLVVYGEDVAGFKGGVFSATKGLMQAFGKQRVFNSPLAESSIVGTAIGLAVKGYKPVVEIQFADYIWTAMNQIRNELAMMRYRSKSDWISPMVIRVPVGGYIHGGHYHSQNIESIFSHIPGLYIAFPSNAADAKRLLKTACRKNDPVLFLEHKYLYRQNFAKSPEPTENSLLAFGKARVVREGRDISIITYGVTVHHSVAAAKEMEKKYGVSVEVIDLRTIIPYDKKTILESVKKTGKVLVAHEDNLTQGFAGELISFIIEQAFEYLDAPILRMGSLDIPIPYNPILEKEALPNQEKIIQQLEKLAKY